MAMDIKREGVVEAKRRKRIIYGAITVLGLVALTAWLWQLEPAPPTIQRSSVYIGPVERGEMVRQVRGPGNLVPVDIRWLTAQTQGKVERKVILPGAQVEPDTVILELSNPELESSTQDAKLAMQRAEADHNNLRAQLESQVLTDRAALAAVESDYQQADLQAQADESLTEDGLIPELTAKLSKLRSKTLENRYAIEKDRFESSQRSTQARLRAGEAALAQARSLYDLRRSQYEALTVRAGIRGVLQQVPVEVGEQLAPGTQLARVARPEELKAELRIAETQAKDVAIGQKAEIDTRNGVIPGRVIRIDPAVINGSVTVDVALEGDLPPGARPDLSVDGTVELERLVDVLYMGRPAYGQANSKVGLFKLDPGGDTATRVQVELGRTSVTTVEIVNGLLEGDRVILSDTSQWEDFDRVRLGG